MAEPSSPGKRFSRPLGGPSALRIRSGEQSRLLAGVARAILCGVPLESVLSQIGRAVSRHLGPRFVALGTGAGGPALAEGWEGPPEWRALLDREPLIQLWHRSFERGRPEELAQAELSAYAKLAPTHALAELSEIVAIPIEARARPRAVLIAGFRQTDHPRDALQALEPYTLLAAFALDREAAHEEQSRSRQSLMEMEAHLRRELSDTQAKLFHTKKMATLGQLVSGIAHELNNPLTSIQGYAQLLLNRRTAAERSEDARRIYEEAERAGRIARNLLLFSRETKPERRPVDLNAVVERTVALRAYELKIENIVMELDLDPALPFVLADAAQLQQVLLNLIVNSEQAIQEERGYGRIRIATRRLPDESVGLEVTDDGPGIPQEIHASVFDPFFTTKPLGVGTGLGLSIVYGIVRAHYGEVSVESESGSGATINVRLPAASKGASDLPAPQVAEPSSLAVVPSPRRPAVASGPRRILVLEDEPTVAQLIADVLSEDEFRVEILLDSRKAWQKMKERHFDLVICDLKMPHLDGVAIYRNLLESASPLQHRLLFVTGDTMSPRTLEFLDSCGLPYLAKPFLVDELKHAVHNALAQFSEPQSAADAAQPHEIIRRK